MTKDEALKLALEALEKVTKQMLALKDELAERGARPTTDVYRQKLWDSAFEAYTEHALPAAAAIKEALAQPEQEPVMMDNGKTAPPENWGEISREEVIKREIEMLKRIAKAEEALAQPAQKPVAYVTDNYSRNGVNDEISAYLPVGTKIYTTPPQRKPLTDEHPLMVFAKECVLGAYKETELADAAQRAIKFAKGIKE